MFVRLTAAIAVAATPFTVSAGPSSYVCDIDGCHTAIPPDAIGEMAMETPLAIDRTTGLAIHPVIGNNNHNEVTLLNRGSADWACKVIADSGGGGNVIYYEVQEYVDGPDKPLLVIAGGIAY